MAEPTHRMKTSDSTCNGSLMLIAFRLGYMSAKLDQIVAKMAAMQPQPAPPPSGPQIMQQIKEVLSFLGALYKAWPIIRWALALNSIGWLAKQGARLLGWL